MIEVKGKFLELTPRDEKSTMPYLNLPLESAHLCPKCGLVIQGIISQLTNTERPYDLHHWSEIPSVVHQEFQSFSNTKLVLADGRKGQLFRCKHHFRDVGLMCPSRKNETTYQRCSFVNGIWELDPSRVISRILEHYKGDTHDYKLFSAMRKMVLADEAGAEKFFEVVSEYGSVGVAPEIIGKTGNVYLMKRAWREYALYGDLGINV